ncbi:SAM-dependent methyltransferase [Streptomyces sp. NPDC048111]|uniref:SAM-dependent methyltransferase n=1 Tax=Streptomyces sp. NPDC048111 TaxID=3365500 RepID=UPI00371EE262
MNREQISQLAHAAHPIAAPLGDDSVRRLLEHAVVRDDSRVLDLGCGGAEWLLRLLAAHPSARAVGVDVSGAALERARAAARSRDVHERLALHRAEAARFTAPEPFDLVLSVGATHAFGGLLPTLAAARAQLAPGGRVLVGEGFWERDPSSEAVRMLGELSDLASTLDQVVGDGWTPVQAHISTREELDAYEWAWSGSLASWALDHRGGPDSAQALEVATAHRDEWLSTYRACFGFVCLILRQTDEQPRDAEVA